MNLSAQLDDSALRRFLPDLEARLATLLPAALRSAGEELAAAIYADVHDATPERAYEGGDTSEHARDGWVIEPRGTDLAVANYVEHIWYLLHGNHANAADGLIHPTHTAALHFFDGGTEVFTRAVQPMGPNPELVAAWDRAEGAAAAFEAHLAARALAALQAGLP